GSQASSASPLAGEPSWMKSSSVVSLGRNVTVSWTKFRTAMRIAAVMSLLRLAPAERLAHVLTLGLPPLVQDGDVGADGEVPDAHVEEVLRLIRGSDLGAGRHTLLDGRFEHAALHLS